MDKRRAVIEVAKKEKRKITADEQKEADRLEMDCKDLDLHIEEQRAMNRQNGKKNTSDDRPFSLRKAIVARMTGQALEAPEARAMESAMKAHNQFADGMSEGAIVLPMTRAAYAAGTSTVSSVLIDQDQQELLLPLEPNLVLAQAGARMMYGLKGDIYWPSHGAVTVGWAGENTAASDGAGTFSKGTVFKPLRLTAKIEISKQLLIQENQSVEAIVRQLLAVAISQKIESTALGTQSSVDNTPDGMFKTLATNPNGDMSWAKVVAMETSADCANALTGNLGYIMHPSLIGTAKTKVKDSSGAGGFVFGNDGQGFLNGYKAFRTTNIPNKLRGTAASGSTAAVEGTEYGIVFGNWNDFFIGQWGGVQLLVDPYTKADRG